MCAGGVEKVGRAATGDAGGWLLLWWLWTGSANQGTALADHKAAWAKKGAASLEEARRVEGGP